MSTSYTTEALQTWFMKVLQKKGLFAADAEFVWKRLAEAESRSRIAGGLRAFADLMTAIDGGDVDPRARTLTVHETPATAVINGGTGLGQVGASRGMHLAVQKAHAVGIGLVIVEHSQPLADVAVIAEAAVAEGCIGWCATNAGKATQALTTDANPFLNAQPQAWSLPVRGTAVVTGWTGGWQQPADLPQTLLGPSLVALALTAGLTGSKWPHAKKRQNPFGGGAEHLCLAIDPTAFGDAANWDEALSSQGSALASAWQRWEVSSPAEFRLDAETIALLTETGTAARVPFPQA